MATLFGWLFDAYPSGQGMTVWLIDPDGRAHALHDSVRGIGDLSARAPIN